MLSCRIVVTRAFSSKPWKWFSICSYLGSQDNIMYFDLMTEMNKMPKLQILAMYGMSDHVRACI